VKVVVDKEGKVLEYEFEKLSGNALFDKSVKDVFKDLSALLPLPAAFDGPLTEIGLRFKP
jgi:outer membrane biosynthesis protein TonB